MFREFADGEPQEEWPLFDKAGPIVLKCSPYHRQAGEFYSYVVLPNESNKRTG